MNKLIPYNVLVKDIGHLLQKARGQAIQTVNNLLVNTYWPIGQHIVEFEQHGKEKATYGAELLNKLSKDLTLVYGKGFSRPNRVYIRKFYLAFPKSETLSHQLSWSHYFMMYYQSVSSLGVLPDFPVRETMTNRELYREEPITTHACKPQKIQTLSGLLFRSHYMKILKENNAFNIYPKIPPGEALACGRIRKTTA